MDCPQALLDDTWELPNAWVVATMVLRAAVGRSTVAQLTKTLLPSAASILLAVVRSPYFAPEFDARHVLCDHHAGPHTPSLAHVLSGRLVQSPYLSGAFCYRHVDAVFPFPDQERL